MADDKKTQLGTAPGRTVRPTGGQPVAATGTPVPASDMSRAQTDASKAKTSYLPEAPDPLLGASVAGRYKIVRKLGEGGMGAVYLAMHTILEKQVALKVLHGEFARKPDLVDRFMQEAKAASRVSAKAKERTPAAWCWERSAIVVVTASVTLTATAPGGWRFPWGPSVLFPSVCSSPGLRHIPP